MINDESRVKPQPLQPEAVTPEEIEYLRGEMAQTLKAADWAQYWMKRLIATISALRKEPPAPGKSVLETIDEYRREHPGAIESAEAELEAEGAFADLPPALPAEVEAVVFDLHDACVNLNYEGACGCCGPCKAATLLRHYAQAVAEWREAERTLGVEYLNLRQEVAEKDADSKHFRARVFLASSHGASAHSTGCTIWGDDGQGHTEEGFTQPLPCNCGALINFHKKEVATLLSEAREKDAEIARLTAFQRRVVGRVDTVSQTTMRSQDCHAFRQLIADIRDASKTLSGEH